MTTSPIVVVYNAVSQLQAPAPVFERVRQLVAYQEADLPPMGLQRKVQALFVRWRGKRPEMANRRGYDNDVERIYTELGPELEAAGWTADRMDRQTLERLIRQRPTDGWVSLVGKEGWFGTGLLGHVRRAVELRCGLPLAVVDARGRPPAIATWGQEPALYDHQLEAVRAFLSVGQGTCDLPPRTGKTRIAAYLVHRLGLPTLYVAPQVGIVEQTVHAFRAFFPPEEVQALTGSSRPSAKQARILARARVWVATPGSAIGPKPRAGQRAGVAGIQTRQFLILDECHHAAAAQVQELGRICGGAWYRLGLTGTHFRSDSRDLEMLAVTGPAVYSRSVSDMVAAGRLVPARIAMVRVPGWRPVGKGRALYAGAIVEDEARNGLAVRAVQALAGHGKRVLVLCKEIEHTQILARMLPGSARVDGSSDDVAGVLEWLAQAPGRVVIGTSVIGEGRDVPAADALVYPAGGVSRVKVIQDSFRVLTPHPGKRWGLILDFADDHQDRLTEAAAMRLAVYRAEPAFTAEVIDPSQLEDWVHRMA